MLVLVLIMLLIAPLVLCQDGAGAKPHLLFALVDGQSGIPTLLQTRVPQYSVPTIVSLFARLRAACSHLSHVCMLQISVTLTCS